MPSLILMALTKNPQAYLSYEDGSSDRWRGRMGNQRVVETNRKGRFKLQMFP